MESKNCKSGAKMQGVRAEAGRAAPASGLEKTRRGTSKSPDGDDHLRRLRTLESGPSADTEDTWDHLKRLEDLEAGPSSGKAGSSLGEAGTDPEKRKFSFEIGDEAKFTVKKRRPDGSVIREEDSLLVDKNVAYGRAHYEWAVKTGVWEDWVDAADWHENNAGFSGSKK
ncbi:hypothetical protein E8E14_000315 [Neopestalotiopsis sp. 37M]|nr:hypothetical protein E8E14_000315 [Neopestalotiopsis sp. 37M]